MIWVLLIFVLGGLLTQLKYVSDRKRNKEEVKKKVVLEFEQMKVFGTRPCSSNSFIVGIMKILSCDYNFTSI